MSWTPPLAKRLRALAITAALTFGRILAVTPQPLQSFSPVRRPFTRICSLWEAATPRPYPLRPATFAPMKCAQENFVGASTRFPTPGNSVMTPGRKMLGPIVAPSITGPECPSTRKVASSMSPLGLRRLIFMVATASATISSPTA